jgi:hypothetical protein
MHICCSSVSGRWYSLLSKINVQGGVECCAKCWMKNEY